MKAYKSLSDSQTAKSQTEKESRISKPPFFPYISKLRTPQDIQIYLKKNLLFRKIDFKDISDQESFKRILRRNYKYLKGVIPPKNFYIKSKYSEIKKAKCLEDINLLPLLSHLNLSQKLYPPNQTRMQKAVQILSKGNIPLKRLKVTSTAFNYIKIKHPKELKNISNLCIDTSIVPEKIRTIPLIPSIKTNTQKIAQAQLRQFLSSVAEFERLISLNLDLTNNLPSLEQDLFYEIFNKLSDLKHLTDLRILAEPEKLEKRKLTMKKTMEKFTKLSKLTLDLELVSSITCGTFFSNLLPLQNLKSLSLKIRLCKSTLDCSDICNFISSLPNLQSLKLYFQYLIFSEHDKILKSVQKLKHLKRFSLKQDPLGGVNNATFAFGILKKTVQSIKTLQKVHIDLGTYTQDPQEINLLSKFIQSHPSLTEVTFCLNMHLQRLNEYKFNNEFYSDIRQLINSLKKFELKLRNFPEEISSKIIKTFVETRKNDRDYICQTSKGKKSTNPFVRYCTIVVNY